MSIARPTFAAYDPPMPVVFGLLSYVAYLLALPFLMLHPKVKQGVRERLGAAPRGWEPLADRPIIWMHGASAGDMLALVPTAEALRGRLGPGHIMASTMTNSGYAIAKARTQAFDRVIYCPYDLPHAVAKVIDRIKPNVLVLEYTELWPNLILAAKRRHIPIVLHNGRLSDARLKTYRRLFMLTGNLLQALSVLLMRDAAEASRARSLGAYDQNILVTGNTKFDNLSKEPDPAQVAALNQAAGFEQGWPVWVAGSTHEGEEEQIFALFARLRERRGPFGLIVAPRYPERAERLMALAAKNRLPCRRRSRVKTHEQDATGNQVLVIDTLGELNAAYSLATVVFVGGSFVPRGGQNILEPAACGKPVLFGPHMHNFVDSLQVLLGRGGIQVSSWAQLEQLTSELLAQPETCKQLGAVARRQVRATRGAAARNAEIIAQIAVP